MKDTHKKHKHQQEEDVHIHRHRQIEDKHMHRHRHEDEEHTHKKCRRKRDRSQERSRSRSRSRERLHNHRDRRKDHNHRTKREHEVLTKEEDHKIRVKSEPMSDVETKKRYTGRSHLPQQYLPKSKWENEDSDSKSNLRDNEARWGKGEDKEEKKPMENKAKPDFGLSGKLAEEVNTYKGVVIKYSEPAEARMPKRRWRLYPFKGDTALPTLYIHRQSAYLIGRDRIVVDLPVDHPSCSKQHAVLQYRVVSYTRDNGSKGNRIRPYIIDLESANGTFVNNQKIEPRKYVELLEKDVIKFAFSSREYVLLHEHSKDADEDDNVILNE